MSLTRSWSFTPKHVSECTQNYYEVWLTATCEFKAHHIVLDAVQRGPRAGVRRISMRTVIARRFGTIAVFVS
jgi:hypothetical protein